jgi:PAS domain S-box-containing protein
MKEFITLNKNNCKNCYKCIRNCPVKSIQFSGNKANVITDECILCGRCYVNCPQNAKEITSDLEKAKVILQQNDKVIISLAPSFVANYENANLNAMKKAIKALGFFDVEETALGAQDVKNEYEKHLHKHKPNIFITSACHSINLLIQKHYPDLIKYLAPIKSPMQVHGLKIKERYPQAKVIFVGPCIAKKDEVDHYQNIIDCALTFDELSTWLKEEQIKIDLDENEDHKFKSRFFPTSGGIIKSLNKTEDDYHYIAIDGIDKCISTLDDIRKGKLDHCFIEMSACEGSCVGGPIMEKHHKTPLRDYLKVVNYSGQDDLPESGQSQAYLSKNFVPIHKDKDMPCEEEIRRILEQMGKTSKKDELNCGTCGYNTCYEKAIAIYQGKADYTMCLPFLKERAESFYHNILDHTPSSIIVLNEKHEIQQFNDTAKKLFNIYRRNDVLGEKIYNIFNHQDLKSILDHHEKVKNNQVYLTEYGKYVRETIVHDRDYKITMIILDDISQEINDKKNKSIMNKQTVEVADQVIDKQMRIVQEIASLLGETTAETKIALSKLKEQILDE